MGLGVDAPMPMFDKLWELIGAQSVAPRTVDLKSLQIRAGELIQNAEGFSEAERIILLNAVKQLTHDNDEH